MLKTFMKEEKKLLKGLKTKYFQFIMIKSMKNKCDLKEKKKKEREKRKTKRRIKRKQIFKYIENKSKGISYDLFREYFNFETLLS